MISLSRNPFRSSNVARKPAEPPRAAETKKPAAEPKPSMAQARMQDGFDAPSQTERTRAMLGGDAAAPAAPAAKEQGTAEPAAKGQEVDDARVDQAVDFVLSPADLQTQLDNPDLSQAEKDEMVARLAANPETQTYFYGENDDLSVGQQRDVAKALISSFKSGAMDGEDLLELADANESDLGAQRLVQLIALGTGAREVGGPLDALGQALDRRADAGGGSAETDRLAASIAFTSSKALRETRLNTAAKREEAFRSLSEALPADLYETLGRSELGEAYQEQLVRGAANLFTEHSAELVDRLTRDGETDATVLSKFFAGALLSPDAAGFTMGGNNERKVTDAVTAALGDVRDFFHDRIEAASDQDDREQYARQLGRTLAGVTGASDIVLAQHAETLSENAAARERFSGILGGIVSETIPGGGSVRDAVQEAVIGHVTNALIDDPDAPDTEVTTALFNEYQGALREFEDDNDFDGLVTGYDAGYSAARHNIEDVLERESYT